MDIASLEFSNSTKLSPGEYLGKYRQPMLTDLEEQAKGMTRGRFQKWWDGWFERLQQAEVERLHYLELHFQYGRDQ